MSVRLYSSALLMFALLSAPFGAKADPRYAVKVIGAAGSVAVDINRSGQVVGNYYFGDADRAFLYTGTTFLDLGALDGVNSYATGINDSGKVVGMSDAGDDLIRGFVYANGTMSDLGTLGGLHSYATGINRDGKIVGGASTADTFEGVLPQAYVYSNGAMQGIGTFPMGDASIAFGINDSGQVVGQSAISTDDPPEHPYHAFSYSGGVMSDLGTLGGLNSFATSINNAGMVVGGAGTLAEGPGGHGIPHAFLFVNGAMQDLGAFGGEYAASTAYDINNLGQVVGYAQTGDDSHAFLFEQGQMLDLNMLIDPTSGWTLTSAQGINDLQQIAGTACKDDACFAVRLDLISSVPEPATYGLLMAGLALVGTRLRWAQQV
jgi:probable HAF family extracellular repeat protein